MKLHLSSASGLNAFTGYGDDYVLVNGKRYETSLIVLADQVMPWPVARFDEIAEEHFSGLAGMGLEVVLLGTGRALRFPHPRLTRALASARTGLEVMDTQAACRTFNILVAEERKVAAALLFA